MCFSKIASHIRTTGSCNFQLNFNTFDEKHFRGDKYFQIELEVVRFIWLPKQINTTINERCRNSASLKDLHGCKTSPWPYFPLNSLLLSCTTCKTTTYECSRKSAKFVVNALEISVYAVPDLDLQIRRGGGHPDPEMGGGDARCPKKFFFGPSGLSLD